MPVGGKRPDFSEGFKFWQYRYDVEDTHCYLVKHYDKLNPGGKARNILLPMCGMSVDLECEMEGKFDAIWERGDLIIIPRENVVSYTQQIKGLLNPGGRLLLETIEYDPKTLDPESALKAPPPFPMFPEEIKRLFEPECSVAEVDEFPSSYLYGDKTDYRMYLIVKQ
ncbi:thiopurine s-methyltransferase [Plakobranchus ocellatus]|uniref:Thiopurine s-methyltransferase n=1 Tax=Plakobranchus ocellatus TaxID=259542 RepID=A0AAV4DT28_9GAST|nr:thiopurine s-methyltransferase [Plakobranchus ocellatus]